MSKPTPTHAPQPARHHINVLGQLLKLIPRSIIGAAARQTGVAAKARSYSVLSHLGTMLFAQLAHALSLNDICDWLRLKSRAIAAYGLTPPSRNNLSHANKVRDARFAEQVFCARWRIFTTATRALAQGTRAGANAPDCIASKPASMPWTPPSSIWWPTAWAGPSTGGARRRPSSTCA